MGYADQPMLLPGSNIRPLVQESFHSQAAARQRVNRGRKRAAVPRHCVSGARCSLNCTGFPPKKRARQQRYPRPTRVNRLISIAQALDLRRYTVYRQ